MVANITPAAAAQKVRDHMDRLMKHSIDLDKAVENMAIEKKQVQDFVAPLKQWLPVVVDNKCALRNLADGRDYFPTETAWDHIGGVGRMSTWTLKALTEPVVNYQKKDKQTGEPAKIYDRDSRDAQVLRDYVDIHMFQPDRVDMEKPRLFRTWEDGTLRAVLSKDYARVNNEWMINTAKAFLPKDARVIRYRGNADTMYVDILCPSTVTDTNDGGMGGMIHLGNSEIGERRIIVTPSILRLICTNGAVGWSRLEDEIKMVHRRKDGIIDLVKLEANIKERIEQAMPSFEQGIAAMLGLRAFGVGDTPIANVFAQMAIDQHISKRDIKGVWDAWSREAQDIGIEEAKSAFGLQAALTRYGQKLDPKAHHEFDRIGGSMAHTLLPDWQKFLGRAENLKPEKVEDLVGSLAA